eukprot:GHVL01037200.1.p1 GENE.GHVL01037200.1~~GHVL01037200.1.p1  ORF type:complete len:121 (+),score=7.08 GHVL01037200.1:1100-1462(+)
MTSWWAIIQMLGRLTMYSLFRIQSTCFTSAKKIGGKSHIHACVPSTRSTDETSKLIGPTALKKKYIYFLIDVLKCSKLRAMKQNKKDRRSINTRVISTLDLFFQIMKTLCQHFNLSMLTI